MAATTKSSIKLRPRTNYQTMRHVTGDRIRRYHNVGDPIGGYLESRRTLNFFIIFGTLAFAQVAAVLFLRIV